MSAGWVAGVTRARAMASRRLGAGAARELAAAPSLEQALRLLAESPYRHDLAPGAGLAEAQHGVAATLLWHLRVLAGWQPRAGAAAVRALAAGFEIANTERHLRALTGAGAGAGPAGGTEYRLGALATAWPALARAGTPAELRAALTASPWGDPGGEDAAAMGPALRMSAAARAAALLSEERAVRWAAGRAALLAARQLFVLGRPLPEPAVRRAARVLGRAPLGAGGFDDYRRALPATARWALEGVRRPAELWRAEAAWWARVDADGFALLRGSRFDAAPVVGAVAVLSADAWRVRAALEVAARGGAPLEAFDALA